MKCLAQKTIRKKKKRCNNTCNFLYCPEHWKEKKNRVIAWVTVISLFLGLPSLYFWYTDKFKSPHQQFIDTHYITGIIASYNPGDTIHIDQGAGHISFVMPPNGEVPEHEFNCGCMGRDYKNDDAVKVKFRIKYRTIYLSFIIRDLKTGEKISEIIENQYFIDKTGKVNDYFSDATFFSDAHSLEIKDKYGYPAFTLWVDEINVVHIRGYFYGSLCTMFDNGSVFEYIERSDPNYIQKSENLASKLEDKYLSRHY